MNVILYVMDCLRADHLSAFGYRRNTTPNLDRMAREGVMFRNCFAQSGWTAPSAASLFSSQHPGKTGIHKMRDALNPDIPWLPEVLRDKGYRCAAFSGVYQVSKLRGFDRGFDEFNDLFRDPATIAKCQARQLDTRGGDYCLPLSEDLHERALAWLDRQAGQDNLSTPFFMLVWSIDTHEPFRQPASYNRDADPAYKGSIDGKGRPFSAVRNRKDVQHLIDIYDGSLRYQDEKFGEFLSELERRNILDDTLVIVCGDHGEMFFEHGIAGHGKFPWREQMNVPLIMRCPQVLPAGVQSGALVQLIDVAPTVIDLAGFEACGAFRGASLRPVIEGTRDGVHELLVLEVPFPFHQQERARVVMSKEWKYVEYLPPPASKRLRKFGKEWGRLLSLLVRPGMAGPLYGHHLCKGPQGMLAALFADPWRYLLGYPARKCFHIARDPAELHNRLGRSRDVVDSFRTYLAALDQASTKNTAADAALTAAEEELKITAHLHALGYVED